MKNSSLLFGVVIFYLAAIDATVSAPYKDDKDILANSETRNSGFSFYWIVRPVYGDVDDYPVIEEPFPNVNKKKPRISFMEAGAGWGR